ncbi:MAG: OB-fold domain-containing protein [Pseudomonadota bacterium]
MNPTPTSVAPAGPVALQEGLIAQDASGRECLLASRCPGCELVFFPKRKYCGKCGSAGQRELLLRGSGTVHAFSVIDRKSQFSIIEPPYVQAEVAMPEGVHIFTVLDQCAPQAVVTGMAVSAYVGKVGQDKDGRDVMAYKFRPAMPDTSA